MSLHDPLPRRADKGRPQRIAFVLSSLGAGGAERVVAQLSEQVAAEGTEVTVIAFDRPDEPVFHLFHPQVRLVRLGLPPARGRRAALVQAVRRILHLRRALRKGRFEVVISFLTKVNVLTLAASAGLRLPVVISERNNPLRQPQHPWWRLLTQLTYRSAAAIVIQTERARICLPPSERGRATVIRNPVSRLPVSTGADTRECVAVGRLTEQKGFDLLLSAWAEVAPRFPLWRLVIWGDGPDRTALEEQCQTLGMTGRVSMPGLSATPGAWRETATVLVLPSRFEGSPNVLAEAMAAGIPSIAADCEFGPAELIDHGRDGLLVPVNDVSALARAIARLLDDRALRDRLGQAGRARAKRELDTGVITEQWMDLVSAAAEGRPRPATRARAATLSN